MYTVVCQYCEKPFKSKSARKYCDNCNPTPRNSLGKKFRHSLLTILEFESRQGKKQKIMWARCLCDCGNEKWIRWHNIRAGKTISCGCMVKISAKAASEARQRKATDKHREIINLLNINPSYSLRDIGKMSGVTGEYVRHVLRKYGVQKKNSHSSARELTLENERLRVFIKSNGLTVPVFAAE